MSVSTFSHYRYINTMHVGGCNTNETVLIVINVLPLMMHASCMVMHSLTLMSVKGALSPAYIDE